jgi:hypothetical protein
VPRIAREALGVAVRPMTWASKYSRPPRSRWCEQEGQHVQGGGDPYQAGHRADRGRNRARRKQDDQPCVCRWAGCRDVAGREAGPCASIGSIYPTYSRHGLWVGAQYCRYEPTARACPDPAVQRHRGMDLEPQQVRRTGGGRALPASGHRPVAFVCHGGNEMRSERQTPSSSSPRRSQ